MIQKNLTKSLALATFSLALASCVSSNPLTTTSINVNKKVTEALVYGSKKTITLNISNKSLEDKNFLYRIERIAINPSTDLAFKKNGLCYLYYEGEWNTLPNFQTLSAVKSGKIEQPNISVANRLEQIALQFYGYIEVKKSGLYNFYTQSDDGSKIYIDGELLVSNDGIHPITESGAKIALAKGFHTITVEFFENYGGEFLSVSYSGPDILKRIIPDSAFYIPSSWNCANSKTNLLIKPEDLESDESIDLTL